VARRGICRSNDAQEPRFTTRGGLCLMLGIGATTGIFTVVNAVLLQPLPFATPTTHSNLYRISNVPTRFARFWTSGPEFLDLRRDTHSWASLDAWITGGATWRENATGARHGGLHERRTPGNAWRGPIQGRLISQTDDVPGRRSWPISPTATWQSVLRVSQYRRRETYSMA